MRHIQIPSSQAARTFPGNAELLKKPLLPSPICQRWNICTSQAACAAHENIAAAITGPPALPPSPEMLGTSSLTFCGIACSKAKPLIS